MSELDYDYSEEGFEEPTHDAASMPVSKKSKKVQPKSATTKKATSSTKKKSSKKPDDETKVKSDSSFVFTDKRKLSKASREKLRDQWTGENAAKSRNVMMQALLNQARSKFGVSKVFASRKSLENLMVGIPMPSLALEWLLGNNVFPLQSLVMLAGSWGSCKSALSYEIFRWFYERGGVSVHVDTESKFDAKFACDIMRVDDDILPIMSNRASSIEEMQQLLTHYIKQMKAQMAGTKDEPGPGPIFPVCYCIDSLAGTQSEELQEKIAKNGEAGRSHPVGQLKNSSYLPTTKSWIEGYPFSLLVVSHLKTKSDDNGNTHEYTLGGQSFNFHESFEIRNSLWRKKLINAQFEGVGVRLHCAKNSFGPTDRRIRTRFLWWVEDDEQGRPSMKYKWDWNWSLITLLSEMDGTSKQRLLDRGLRINVKSPAADLECVANFPMLGMGKSDYLPFEQVGEMIQQNEEVCELIRDALLISRRSVMHSGDNFTALLQKLQDEAD